MRGTSISAVFAGGKAAPDRRSYSALAIAQPKPDEFDAPDLYRATGGGDAALTRKYRDKAIRWRHAPGHAARR